MGMQLANIISARLAYSVIRDVYNDFLFKQRWYSKDDEDSPLDDKPNHGIYFEILMTGNENHKQK